MRPYEFPDSVHLQVTYEFDLDLYRVDRDVYSLLDWIGDIGGLREGLYLFLSFLFGFMNYYKFEHFMIEHLYQKRTDNNSAAKLEDKKTRIYR